MIRYIDVIILPPRQLFIPVLPYHSKTGKLMFGLCKTCMEESNQNKCLHNNDKREWVGTYTTVEIQEAIKHGYTIVMIYDIWDYKKKQKNMTLQMELMGFSQSISQISTN